MAKEQNAISLASKCTERELIDAQSVSAQNKALQENLNPIVLELRKLDVQKMYAEAIMARMNQSGKEGDVIIMPYDAMKTVAGQMKAYQVMK